MEAAHARAQLRAFVERGRRLMAELFDEHSGASVPAATRVWQRDCAALVSELSGGIKAHWLSRAFSEALLVGPEDGRIGTDAPVIDIVERIIAVLEQADAAIAQAGGLVSVPDGHVPAPRQFDFVHESALRPVLEQAYADSRDALAQGRHEAALLASATILESIISDALTHAAERLAARSSGLDQANIAEWSFEERIAVAEKAGLIRGGCARLPDVARWYRELADSDGRLRSRAVTPRDARTTAQVLRVVMRDLDPGR